MYILLMNVLSNTCSFLLRCLVYISCVKLEISGYMQGNGDIGVYCDFKKSSYRVAYLRIHLPWALWRCICLSACCYACTELVDWAALFFCSYVSVMSKFDFSVKREEFCCCSVRWQVWYIQAGNNCGIFLVVFMCGIRSPLSLVYLSKFPFPCFSKINSPGLGQGLYTADLCFHLLSWQWQTGLFLKCCTDQKGDRHDSHTIFFCMETPSEWWSI